MDRDVVMALFEPVVLFDIVQVVTSDDNRPAHFSRDDNALENPAADGHVAGEGAFLVDVGSLDGGLRGLKSYMQQMATRSLGQ